MDITVLRKTIEQKAGVPADLLTAETAEGVVEQAKTLLRMREETEAKRPKTTREQFADWMEPETGETSVLDELSEAVRVDAGGYPMPRDGGEIKLPDSRNTREQFSEWFYQQSAWNPRKGGKELI